MTAREGRPHHAISPSEEDWFHSVQTWIAIDNCVQAHQMGTYSLKKIPSCSDKMLSVLSCEQKTAPGTGLSSNIWRRERRSSLSLSPCCSELLPKTAQATQRLHIYWWLHNTESHYTCMPYSETYWVASCLAVGHKLYTEWQMSSICQAQAPSYSGKNISFIKHGDFAFWHESTQSSMFPNLQMALSPHPSDPLKRTLSYSKAVLHNSFLISRDIK